MPDSEMTGNIFFFAGSPATAAQKAPAPAREIVERVCEGDAEAFGELYKMFAPMVHGIILARVRRDEVDDIVQEVFLSAYNNLHTLRDKNVMGAWLASIARNRATEFYRHARPTEELSEELSDRTNRTPACTRAVEQRVDGMSKWSNCPHARNDYTPPTHAHLRFR